MTHSRLPFISHAYIGGGLEVQKHIHDDSGITNWSSYQTVELGGFASIHYETDEFQPISSQAASVETLKVHTAENGNDLYWPAPWKEDTIGSYTRWVICTGEGSEPEGVTHRLHINGEFQSWHQYAGTTALICIHAEGILPLLIFPTEYTPPGPSFVNWTDYNWSGLWLPGNYVTPGGTSGLWTGTASAGTSGGRNITMASNFPSASGGNAVFNGSTQYLDSNGDFQITDILTESAGTIIVIANASAVPTNTSNNANDCVLISHQKGSNPRFGIAHTSTGIRSWINTTGGAVVTTALTAGTGTNRMIVMRWQSGGNISCKIMGGSEQTSSMPNNMAVLSTSEGLGIGRRYIAAGNFWGGEVRLVATSLSRLNDGDIDDLYDSAINQGWVT